MSDNIEALVKQYKDNVFNEEHPRSIGLFTIPEYPEFEADRGMWSVALDAILTTLRYIAPATLLTLFWGQQSFLFKILKHIDSAFRAIVFSSEEQKQAVLQWLAEAGPVRVEHLDTVWRHGWVLCGVLDAALPGACAGHPPTRLSLKHAQAIADHYLGVEPVFSRQELESNDSLSRHQEWKLATYLDRIRLALSKLTPPVSKPVSQRTSPETTQFTLDYVAKGSGLSAAQVFNKSFFKIYPTAQQSLDPGEITILIRGPKDTYGLTVLPPILGKAQLIRQKLLGLQSKQSYTENILPITQGATYLRSYGKNDMNKTYYIPKTKYDIDIEVDSRPDHVKIGYIVNIEGKYLVSITSRGQNIVGSPFTVTASHNIINSLENDTYCLEHGEEIDIVDIKTDRKVVLRIVDFVTEKMLLNENGTMEKITDDEAKLLMTTDINNGNLNSDSETYTDISSSESNTPVQYKPGKFNQAASKVLSMYKVCKILNDLRTEKQRQDYANNDAYIKTRNKQDIPDIVNSTFTEGNVNPYISEFREKFIVPEHISVSLKAEKSKTYDEDAILNKDRKEIINIPMESTRLDTPDSLDGYIESHEEENDVGDDSLVQSCTKNPFLNEMFEENYVASKNFGTFVASEYERNNSQNEETRDSSITIIIEENLTSSPISNSNPFLEVGNEGLVKADPILLERPKTPVYKIISGEKLNRDEPVYVDPKMEKMDEESLGNEFVNPFFMLHHPTAHLDQAPDFIIGAPVSLPSILRARSPEPVQTGNEKSHKNKNKRSTTIQSDKSKDVISESVFSTPLHNNLSLTKYNTKDITSATSSTFHSLESNTTETIDNSNASTTSDNQLEPYHSDSERNITPKKDIWDSAYVSIDDNNSSPDSNNNENLAINDTLYKQKFSPCDNFVLKEEEILKMGPAERELWETCNDLKIDPKTQEDVKPHKRPTFTPILEESDKSISLGPKDISTTNVSTKIGETDTVSVVFAELNDIYQEYYPNSETSSVADEDNKLHSMEVEYVNQTTNLSVDSASDISDVKRHETKLEGMISEVQVNTTESVSASRTLQENAHIVEQSQTKDKTHFGGYNHNNLVLEKKKYWDEKIRQIEAKTAETTAMTKKKRISSKQLKHDSLSKRRGKQMIKNFLSVGDYSQVKNINNVDGKESEENIQEPSIPQMSIIEAKSDEKLVEKWKKYWDDKLETDNMEDETITLRTKSRSKVSNPLLSIHDDKAVTKEESSLNVTPIKQELSEEVFKAFETSPKRFFGTSRKQILNKIDIFSGRPTIIDVQTTDVPTNVCHESGLVSSRISLFHNMSNTEELPWARTKSQSLHNVSQRSDSDKYEESIILEESSDMTINNENSPEYIKLKNKRSKLIHGAYSRTFDETLYAKFVKEPKIQKTNEHVKLAVKCTSKDNPPKINNNVALRKKSFSKSEMDIFNRLPTDTGDSLDKYKSCEELPKINVKNFISMYESVSKTAVNTQPANRVNRPSYTDSQKPSQPNSINSDAVYKYNVEHEHKTECESEYMSPGPISTNLWRSKDSETVSNLSLDTKSSDSYDIEIISNERKDTTYLSLSDIELEIIESNPNKSSESSPERKPEPHIEYKNRFKMAKQYFQSLEELREVKKPKKLNECEKLLHKQSTESLENERPKKRVKKNIKSHSMPSSEISKIWDQLQTKEGTSNTKLVKISEKFNVEDLFTDVTEGKLSRQGSLRGIPHKKAVLEAFRSMENISDTTMNSYEIVESPFTDFGKDHKVKSAQTYLNEYPYLPTTDPSKYHSRLDVKASGLISLKELLAKKPRRNSVPDIQLNPKFTVDL